MKVFAPGLASSISTRIVESLGLPKHIRQGRVLVAAPTKIQAFRLLCERHLDPGSVHDREFRMAMGNDVDALAEAGLFDAPVVLALAGNGVPHPGRVVRVEPDGTPTVIGHTERDGGGHLSPLRFVPTTASAASHIPGSAS